MCHVLLVDFCAPTAELCFPLNAAGLNRRLVQEDGANLKRSEALKAAERGTRPCKIWLHKMLAVHSLHSTCAPVNCLTG